MKPLLYLPGVDTDLINGAIWYEEQQQGLGKRFLTEFDLVCHRIPFFPEMYSEVYNHVRRVLIRDFKFSIYYRVMEKHIEIIAVLSNRINPDTIAARILSPAASH